jgi:hypothetical protein
MGAATAVPRTVAAEAVRGEAAVVVAIAESPLKLAAMAAGARTAPAPLPV